MASSRTARRVEGLDLDPRSALTLFCWPRWIHTAVRFSLGNQPVFGLSEGLLGLDRRGAKDEMHNGQGSSDSGIRSSRLRLYVRQDPSSR
jgi:hypothetical protein